MSERVNRDFVTFVERRRFFAAQSPVIAECAAVQVEGTFDTVSVDGLYKFTVIGSAVVVA